MKVIFLNRFFHPDLSATSQMLSDLAFELSARGHQAVVITSRLRYDEPSVPLPAEEVVAGVRIVRVATSRFGRDTLAGRAVDYATFYVAAAYRLWRVAGRGDVVVAMTDPPMLSVLAAPVAWVRGARLVNWLQDIFPETAEVLGFSRGLFGRTVLAAIRRVRDASLRAAWRTVVIGERMAQRVRDIGLAGDRIAVIHNWADGRALRPVGRDRNDLRKAWGLDQAFVVGYSGNLGRAHETETLVAAIRDVEATVRDGDAASKPIVWLFIGGGAQSTQLREEAGRLGLRSLRFEPYQPRERLAESLSVADIHLVSLRSELEGLIVPSKFYGIAAAGRPAIFIGDPEGEIARIVKSTGIGFVVAQGDGPSLREAVLRAAQNPAETEARGHAARQVFEAAYDLPRAVAAWERVLMAGGPGLISPARTQAGSSDPA